MDRTLFFPAVDDFPLGVSRMHCGVQPVSDLVPDLLVHLEKKEKEKKEIHFCQDEHEKLAVLSRGRHRWFVPT